MPLLGTLQVRPGRIDVYSQKVIERNLANFAQREGWMPVYHSIAQVQDLKDYIARITTVDSNQRNSYITVNQKLNSQQQAQIKRWIENEQVLCSLDSGYLESRYCMICDEKGEIFQFKNRQSQEIFDAVLGEFDDLAVAIELLVLKGRQLGVCLGPDTKVLMASLEWKRIDDVRVGEELIAVDELPIQGSGKKRQARRMRTTKVETKMERIHETLEIVLDTGAHLIATPEHPFLCGIRGGSGAKWRRSGEIRVGDRIRRIVNVWDEGDREDAWLGGLIDGEGALQRGKRSGARLTVSQVSGSVLDHARKIMEERYYPVRESVDRRTPESSSKLGTKEVYSLTVSRMETLFCLLGRTRPIRFKDRRWWEDKELPGKHIGGQWATVVSITPAGRQRVVNIQTSTNTFVAEGVVSHNTTKVALKFLHRLLFMPHTQAVMASVQADKSELIARILDVCVTRLPWWLIPRRTTDRIKLLGFDNGSILSVQSGMQATGIAQGWTPTLVHVSELGDIPNPKKVLEEGLFRATHPTRRLFAVYEGTGGGSTGWLADKWRSAKEDWPKGKSRLCPLFLSWPLAPDLYPEADWERKFPIPDGWEPCAETKRHILRCEVYIRNTPLLSQVCGSDWKMPRRQQYFWEFNYLEACKSHTQKIWLSQMPADDYEALTGKNDTIFNPEVIELADRNRHRNYQAYAITGDSIDDGFEPDTETIDYDKPRILVSWESHRGQTYKWTMVPLLPFDEGNNDRNALDKILIFKEPKAGCDYSIGIDTADGLDKEDEERSALSIARNVTGESCDEQVCELCSRRINPPQMVGFAACLAAWYGKRTKDPRGCKFAIEQRMRPGDDCQLQLKLMGFNFHHKPVRYDNKKLDSHGVGKEGFFSNYWSVPMLMNRFVDAINNGWYKANSPWLIKELQVLERKIVASAAGGTRSRMEHQTGKFDDRVRSAAMSYFTRHDFDILADRAQKRYAVPEGKPPDVDYGWSNSNQLSVGA